MLLFLINLLSMTTLNESPSITYNVFMEQPATHQFRVEMRIKNIQDNEVEVKLPVWTPGSYLIREYAKNIDYVRAADDNGNSLTVIKTEKNTWKILSNKKNITIEYGVYAFEESLRTSYLDDVHASVVPASIFLYVEKYDVPLIIQFIPYKDFKQISTSLEIVGNDKWTRKANNKDILYDSPVEIGNQNIYYFTAAGVEYEICMVGKANYTIDKIVTDLPKIIEQEVKIFGENPLKKYVFIIQNNAIGGGGLEHANSVSLMQRRLNYEPESNYKNFLSLCSHEYFHVWNVKRLRPVELGPFNYEAENYTTSLWIVEGFTSYYDDLILQRCGISTNPEYLNTVESNINTIANTPGDSLQSAADASFDAWLKYYRPSENAINTQMNYYSKGNVLAMILDLKIIYNTNGKYSLDDVMKYAYEEYYKKLNRGYTVNEFKEALEKFAGEDLTSFYADYINGTKKIDYAKYFNYIGIELADVNEGNEDIDPGWMINDKNIITQLRSNSPAENAGLNVNDEIISVDGFRLTGNLPAIFMTKKAGDAVNIIVNRSGLMRNFDMTLKYSDKINYQLSLNQNASEQQKELYKKWLHSNEFR